MIVFSVHKLCMCIHLQILLIHADLFEKFDISSFKARNIDSLNNRDLILFKPQSIKYRDALRCHFGRKLS